ncbi:uncharacterized protein LOC127836940 [Dreissena polymorpha]|uniref:uncharacterized protein LOC127836940 n=1 Tax=Dreissena polymorpha TaxID=45954 RepID=UPI002263FD93|nr:uncharacterized protein LOC127836940 [Dreissena polymorpha]
MPAIHTYDATKVTFHVFDTHVRKITIADMQTVEDLVQYFEKRIEDGEVYRDLYMARSILVWMSHMVNWKLKQNLPKSIQGLVDENSYPPLTFSMLCEAAHIANKTIVGKAKDVTFEPGYPYKDIPQGMWNSFLCNNTWHLVFTELAIARASGYRRGGEIVIESDGNRKFEPQQSNKGQDVAIFSEFWFCISPKIMSRQAFPEDPTFQYMPMGQYLSQSDFASCALLLPEFYRSDMTLLSENACVLQSKRGRCVINIGCPSGSLKGVEFTYKLCLIVQKGKDDACAEHIQAFPRMVVFAPGMDGVTFTISLPVTGEYTFSTAIKTKTNDHNRNPECFKFKIICNEIDKYCRNIPQSVTEMGVGFTPVAKDFGLKHPSNIATTLVVKCDPDQLLASDIEVEPESVIFRVAEDRINEVEFTSEFLDDIDNIGFSEVNLDKEKGELEVKAGLKKPGESVLVVKGREIARGQDFQPILNYIVSSHEKVDDNYERRLRHIKRVNASNKKKDAKEDYKAQLKDHVIAIRKEIENLNKAVIKTHELQLKVNIEVNKEVKTTSELYENYPANSERGFGLTFDDSAHFQQFTSLPKSWQTDYSVSEGSKSAEVLTSMAFSCEDFSDTEVKKSQGGANLHEHASTKFKADKKYIHLKNRHMRLKNTLILEQTRVARLEQVKLKEEIAVLKLKRGHLEKSSFL